MTKEFLTYWPFCLYYSPCCCCVPSCIPCLLQRCFYSPSWFYKYYKLQTVCAFVSRFYRVSPVYYCCTKCTKYHFWIYFSCLCADKKWVQTYYHSISFLCFTSACDYFLGKIQRSPSSEVYLIQLFFIISALEAAIMLSSKNLFLCPFLPLSLKFLVYQFMAYSVSECAGLSYALEIQRNMVLCWKSFRNFLWKIQFSSFINVFLSLLRLKW